MKLNRHFFLLVSLATLAHAATSFTLFVSDASGASDVVNVFDNNGNLVNTIAPPGGFDSPAGIALAPNGNIYIANQSSAGNPFVYEYNTTTGLFSTFVPFTNPSGLITPQGIAFDSAGNLYVVDQQNDSVDEFDSSGNFVATVVPVNSLAQPVGITVGPGGDLYIADDNGVEKWDGTTLTSFATVSGAPEDLAFGPDGDLYVTDEQGVVHVYDTSGTELLARDFGQSRLVDPFGLAFSPDGDAFITSADALATDNAAASAVVDYDPLNGNWIEDFAEYNGTTFIDPTFLAFGPAEVPEPASWLLGALGLTGILAFRKRGKTRSELT